MYIANCPFNKMKILREATIGLEKSFPMIYSNIGLNSRETVPLTNFSDVLQLSYKLSNFARENKPYAEG